MNGFCRLAQYTKVAKYHSWDAVRKDTDKLPNPSYNGRITYQTPSTVEYLPWQMSKNTFRSP